MNVVDKVLKMRLLEGVVLVRDEKADNGNHNHLKIKRLGDRLD